jgi:SAM-dependent methyltransferase
MSWWTYQGARARALTKRVGPSWLRARAWSWEFRHGHWTQLEHLDDRALYEVVVSHLTGGRLLDLGCGNGTVRCELPVGALQRYVGVDLSGEALRQTRARAEQLPRLPLGDELFEGDIADPGVLEQVGGPYDVVLLRESIYYLRVDQVGDLLHALAARLADAGVIVVKVHDRDRYADHLEAVRASRPIVAEHRAPTNTSTILVTR